MKGEVVWRIWHEQERHELMMVLVVHMVLVATYDKGLLLGLQKELPLWEYDGLSSCQPQSGTTVKYDGRYHLVEWVAAGLLV